MSKMTKTTKTPSKFQADKNGDGKLSREEFLKMMLDYSNNCQTLPRWTKYWKTIAYADVYTCSPPKLFIPTMCLLQIAVWIYYEVYSSESSIYTLLVKLPSFAWDFLCVSLCLPLSLSLLSLYLSPMSLSIYLFIVLEEVAELLCSKIAYNPEFY
jgi:hypothetical protein